MVLFVGACACFFGYGLIWLSVTLTLPRLPFWLLWMALIVATNSNAWFGTAVLVTTNMKNFPLSRGTVAGILKGYSAIGGAVYTVIYNVFLDQYSTKLLLFLALGIPVICFSMMYFIRPCAPASGEDSSEHVHFVFTQAMACLAALVVLVITVVGSLISVSSSVTYYTGWFSGCSTSVSSCNSCQDDIYPEKVFEEAEPSCRICGRFRSGGRRE